jgi:hypothetical protein
VVFVGQSEQEKGVVTIKHLESGTQAEVSLEELNRGEAGEDGLQEGSSVSPGAALPAGAG